MKKDGMYMSTVNVQIDLNELLNGRNAQVQLSVPQLVEKVLKREEGKLTTTGAVSVLTGKYTGRSPKDKFIVNEASTADKIDWGTINQPISQQHFENLYTKVLEYLKEKEEIFIFKGFAGADPSYRLPIQVIDELIQ
jgi:phosphoenolpyruvate carboxykinase (ATP)